MLAKAEIGTAEPSMDNKIREMAAMDDVDSSVKNAETEENEVQTGTEDRIDNTAGTVYGTNTGTEDQGRCPESGTYAPGQAVPLEIPPYQKILAEAKARNPESEELQLTIDEIMYMLSDSNFQREMPELAEQCYQALKMFEDSG